MNPRLIMDVGMHDGSDTAFYLAKGFDVVAVEANPLLVDAARSRFGPEIEGGRLRIVDAAVAERAGMMTMAVSETHDVWSTLSDEFLSRNEQHGVKFTQIEVPTRTFDDVLTEFGAPYYLKIDIEGLDMLPVRALRTVPLADRPRYVSVESSVTVNQAPFSRVFDELAELWSLGYRRFMYVNQREVPAARLSATPGEGSYVDFSFPEGASGPFGRELAGRWLGIEAALARANVLRLHHNLGGLNGRWRSAVPGRAYVALRHRVGRRGAPWYDLHAMRPGERTDTD